MRRMHPIVEQFRRNLFNFASDSFTIMRILVPAGRILFINTREKLTKKQTSPPILILSADMVASIVVEFIVKKKFKKNGRYLLTM